MPRRFSPLTLAAAALAALAFSGCGSGNPRMLSEDDSQTLIATVDSIEQSVADGDCERALAQVAELQAQVGTLPPTVAKKLRDRLAQGASHLQAQVPQDCAAEEEATPTPTETPTETSTPVPTPTPAPTEVETPTPAETEEPQEPEQPPEPEQPEEGQEGEDEEAAGEGAASGNGNGKGNADGKDNGKGKGKGKGKG